MNNEKAKILLPKISPLITSYPQYANIFSIVGDNENKMTWFYENMISLQATDDMNNFRLDFHVGFDSKAMIGFCPVVYIDTYPRDIISKAYNDVTDFFVDQIDKERCLYFVVCTNYIPEYVGWRNEKIERNHDIMICGYDKEKQVFYAADFFEGPYSQREISFDDIRNGYNNVDAEGGDWMWGVKAMHTEKSAIYDIKYDKLVVNLRDYLNSASPVKYNDLIFYRIDEESNSFGISVYEKLKQYVRYVESTGGRFDRRVFHLLYDHKVLMKEMILHISKYGHLKNGDKHADEMDKISCMALILRNIMLKYNLTYNASTALRMIEQIDKIKARECEAIENLIGDIGTPFDDTKSLPKMSLAKFISVDTETKGTYAGKYGTYGYEMSYIGRNIPVDMGLNITYKFKFCNDDKTDDVRALTVPGSNARISASYVGKAGSFIEIKISTDRERRVSIYINDWWRGGSGEIIKVYSGKNDSLLHEYHIENTDEGVYLRYTVCGYVVFRIFAYKECNAPYFSGVFVD